MRVAVNLTWLTPGRVGGSEEYLTRQLAGLDRSHFDLDLFVEPAFVDAHPALSAEAATHAIPFAAGGRATRIVLEHTWLAHRTRAADVVHHGGGTVPLIGPSPTVLTLHDLQYRTYPQYFSATRRRYLSWMIPRSVGRADVVAVPSEFVRAETIDAFDVPDDRVMVVPHGVPVPDPVDADTVTEVRRRYGIGGRPYVVYPAITHPHKGHAVLVDAAERLDPELVVVLIGGAGASEEELAERIARSDAADRILRPGRVPTSDRDALLAAASALVFPSEFEGFGAPVVEAMASGTPVVASNAAALVEVVGDAGVIVPDVSPDAWVSGVEEALRRRDELSARGRDRAAQFTLGVSGAALAEVYRRAAS